MQGHLLTVQHAKALYVYTFEFTTEQQVQLESLTPSELVDNIRHVFTAPQLQIDPNDHPLVNWTIDNMVSGNTFIQKLPEWQPLLLTKRALAEDLLVWLNQGAFHRISRPMQLYALISRATQPSGSEHQLLDRMAPLISHIMTALECCHSLWHGKSDAR